MAGLIGAGLLLTLSASSCDGSKSDAPFKCNPSTCINGTRTTVVKMPDGFRNVAFTCNGVNGIYVTSRGWNQDGAADYPSLPSAIAVVPNDPNCR